MNILLVVTQKRLKMISLQVSTSKSMFIEAVKKNMAYWRMSNLKPTDIRAWKKAIKSGKKKPVAHTKRWFN